MPMNASYLAVLASAGASDITHVGLVDETGTEIASAGYARQPVTWAVTGGEIRLDADKVFTMTEGDVVGGWRGYTALTDGTDRGGDDVTERTYSNDGTYTLEAALTAIDHTAGV